MNRQQRRRAAHALRATPKSKDARSLVERARFETDLRAALERSGISLVSIVPGQEQLATGAPTGATYWVLVVREGDRSVTLKSPAGAVEDVAAGVLRALAPVEPPPSPAPPEAELSLGERIRRAQAGAA